MWERGGEWGVLPLPVLSPCNKLDMVLGTGGSCNVRFMLVAEAGIITGTRSGRSWGISSGGLHPFAWVCQSRTQVDGILGGAVGGAHSQGSVESLQQTGVV